jgi:D-alanyl-D-alanine carboxypeptidase/D-alanyl-D-alanine-endopeptidase (penicillin-binding protein 4)
MKTVLGSPLKQWVLAGLVPFVLLSLIFTGWVTPTPAIAGAEQGDLNGVVRLIGKNDAVLVVDGLGRPLVSRHVDRPLIPASTLKILTSLVAIHHLGLGYRFPTEFYTDGQQNLKIKGYGDPLLVSEEVAGIARELRSRLQRIENIIVDDSHFTQPLVIPGISSSAEPYDAPNGALCVNFNTVNFKKANGVYVSAEPQTPLLSFALPRVKKSGLDAGRIVFSHEGNQCTLYAGHLFGYFLRQEGVAPAGRILLGKVEGNTDRLVYRHHSRYTLEEIIARLLEHSNNFTTNQILIAAGVAAFGGPGTLSKGVRAATQYAAEVLQLEQFHLAEGSGISRDNRITARGLDRVLEGFEPYRYLMRKEGRTAYKTGTLHGISTRAGYIDSGDGSYYRFAVLINTGGKSTDRVMRNLLKALP